MVEILQYPWCELYSPANVPNWLLVAVGAGAVFAALKTLRTIKDQADTMGRQTDLLKQQIDMSIAKERAKLRIELDSLHLVPSVNKGGYVVTGSVSIYGSTEAFIERSEIYASIGEEGINNPLPESLWGMHLDPVIRAGSPAITFDTLINAKDGPATDEEMLPVREAKVFVYCIATIEFSDTFGQRWKVRLRKFFRPVWKQVGLSEIDFLGTWMEDHNGMAWENQEYLQPPEPPLFRPTEPKKRQKPS